MVVVRVKCFLKNVGSLLTKTSHFQPHFKLIFKSDLDDVTYSLSLHYETRHEISVGMCYDPITPQRGQFS